MRVQRVIMPASEVESWTVVDDAGSPVAPIESFVAYLAAIERSPNTVRAYASSLRLFEFLSAISTSFDAAGVNDAARFVAWLRAPSSKVVVLDSGTARRQPATVNRHLAAVFAFYEHHARVAGGELAERLRAWRPAGRRSYKPFLHHATRGQPVVVKPMKLVVPKRTPATLTAEQVLALIEACDHLRDKFLIALLAETGMRVGQARGLRHSDFVSRQRQVHIFPRDDNANGARAKTATPATVPVSSALVRLYSEYLHVEYGGPDSDYVFVNLWAPPVGAPLS